MSGPANSGVYTKVSLRGWFQRRPMFLDGMRDRKRGRYPVERSLMAKLDGEAYEAGRQFAVFAPHVTTKDLQLCINNNDWRTVMPWLGDFLTQWNSMLVTS